jgi:hypothetical protein
MNGYNKAQEEYIKFCKVIPFMEDHSKFLSKISIDVESKCWIWGGYRTRGHGAFSVGGSIYKAHRISWEIFIGRLTYGLVIDHMCRNRACVNPKHLREVTNRVNCTENNLSIPALNKIKSHCKNGHLFCNLNSYKTSDGYRRCKICSTESRKKYRANPQCRERLNARLNKEELNRKNRERYAKKRLACQ